MRGGAPRRVTVDPISDFAFLLVPQSGASVRFLRGDSSADGGVDLADAVHVLVGLFSGGEPGDCEEARDSNADGAVGVSDAA